MSFINFSIMPHEYKGTIVEESLNDNRILNDFKIVDFRISRDENPADRWHLYTVMVSHEDIIHLSENMKPKWYAHFWKDRDVIAIFHGQKFEFNYDDRSTWKEAIDYGLSMGIPAKQLDFVID